MEKKRDTKFVEVSIETHQKLGKIGAKNEKYGEIVKRLIDTVEEYQRKYGGLVECK